MSKLFTPLRSVVGEALSFSLELDSLSVSAELANLEVHLQPQNDFHAASQADELLTYRPQVTFQTSDGRATWLPDPQQLPLIANHSLASPFPNDAPFYGIFARSQDLLDDDAPTDRMSATFAINLTADAPLVGGIAYCGYPELEYSIDQFGQSSANYGLPREFRLSVAAHAEGDRSERNFIDSDLHYTQQEMNHASGFHFMHIEPTKAKQLSLKVSDIPRLVRHIIHRTDGSLEVRESRGMVIPYLYVFAWQEQTHYQHHVPGGTIAVVTDTPREPDGLQAEPVRGQWRRFGGVNDTYQTFSGAAPFRPASRYRAKPTDLPDVGESFVSMPVPTQQSISLVCQQSDEFLRTLSGIELWLPIPSKDNPNLEAWAKAVQLPIGEVTPVQKVGLRIFELDFPSGVSSLRCRNKELRKYKYLLADRVVTNNQDVSWKGLQDHLAANSPPGVSAISFSRPSNLKTFEIELTNLGEEAGQFVVMLAEWIQSAHVSLHPMSGRRLRASTLHFRLIGENLAEDYSKLGDSDFNFSVEHATGNGPVRKLLSVRSLADLMQSGHARILGNSRRRAVEFEKSNVYSSDPTNPYAGRFPEETGDNFDVRQSDLTSHGWTQVESGDGVHKPDGKQIGDSYTTQEARAHTDHLYPQTFLKPGTQVKTPGIVPTEDLTTPWEAAANYLNLGHGLFTDTIGTVGNWFLADADSSLLIPGPVRDTATGSPENPLSYEFNYWRGVAEVPIVTGMKSVAMSPFSPVPIAQESVKGLLLGIEELYSQIRGIVQPDPLAAWGAITNLIAAYQTLSPMFPGFLPASLPALAAFNAGNGFNVGGSVLFLSSSSSLLTPALTYQHSFGSQGAISKSSAKTCFMRSETVRRSDDHTQARSVSAAGENKRVVERREVPGTDQQRMRGAEIMWNGEAVDIVLGQIPLDVSFPALAERGNGAHDESLRVRFGNGIGPDIRVDFWFEVQETEISDDF